MPSIHFDADLIETQADLCAILGEQAAKGWIGSLGYGADGPSADAAMVWRLDMHTAVPTAIDGVLGADGIRRLMATIGDWKVTIGAQVTTMTAAVYEATYGGA